MKIIASLVLYRHEYQSVSRTLTSLLEEESVSKLVIVDNGAYCHWLLELDNPKIEVIRVQENAGFGAGHNQVFSRFEEHTGHFLICNPDIDFEKGEVDKLYQFCLQGNIDLAVPKIVYPDGRLQHACKTLPSPYQLFMRRFISQFTSSLNQDYELHSADYSKPFFAPSLSGCFMLVSNKAVRDVGYFDTRFFLYLEDVDLSRRICENHRVSYCPDSVVVHESQRRSYRDKRFLAYHIISAVKYFNKWGWFFDQQRKDLNNRCLSKLPRAENNMPQFTRVEDDK
ncbi:glycosyltransferase [Serratia fonticola]|uniref:glycosyltransferase n=1 Tax=Serratia fonticola TaxID=47917 RepID=UPI0003AF1E26|nr:glycosyltransferase family 2 protein [Serratia fonticola]ERK14655.1 putative glycosyl transferase family 2 [Serratia fonticola AU-AP2C]MBP0995478.1 glycosyltransferase family 2 protein [Serratia fonticola]MBP1001104.1 glycosyltransferase family 2 protein [Serratia fonticola]MBP1010298.1 glycosyltransferase family 2 protein [Serratia fonticola]NXZ86176.1 glycosyltransferase family 2 protein [Serratia fonticola]